MVIIPILQLLIVVINLRVIKKTSNVLRSGGTN